MFTAASLNANTFVPMLRIVTVAGGGVPTRIAGSVIWAGATITAGCTLAQAVTLMSGMFVEDFALPVNLMLVTSDTGGVHESAEAALIAARAYFQR